MVKSTQGRKMVKQYESHIFEIFFPISTRKLKNHKTNQNGNVLLCQEIPNYRIFDPYEVF